MAQECLPPLLEEPHTTTLVAGSSTHVNGSYVESSNATVQCFWNDSNVTVTDGSVVVVLHNSTENSTSTISESAACSNDTMLTCFTLTVAVLGEGTVELYCNISCDELSLQNTSNSLFFDIISKLISITQYSIVQYNYPFPYIP